VVTSGNINQEREETMTKPAAKTSTVMDRYSEAKAVAGDAVLVFRMGDFYELFAEDAVVASKVLGLTLTTRDKTSAKPTAMVGFPYHQIDGYLKKLIQAGCRVAVCGNV
jgi:DNA mismatch repair protein MutS